MPAFSILFFPIPPHPRVDLPSSPDRVHQALRLDEPRRVDLMPLPLARDAPAEGLGDLVVAGAAAEEGADVGLIEGEEAVPELAVGGQADAVAAHAKGAADRGDQADPAAAVG